MMSESGFLPEMDDFGGTPKRDDFGMETPMYLEVFQK